MWLPYSREQLEAKLWSIAWVGLAGLWLVIIALILFACVVNTARDFGVF